MAKQIEGVYEAVLACAKKEFLEKGYTDASLRTIAQEAGTSTSSIYTRFKDKPAPSIPALRTRKVCSRPLLGLPPPR